VIGEGLLNKKFLTDKWSPPIAEEYEPGYMHWWKRGVLNPLGQAMPITGQQFDYGGGRTFGGFLGLPIYGVTQEEREAIRQKRIEDRAKAQENR
jgi:hypothetical protein